jgi:O-antigen biosynthesis protein
VIDLTTDGHAVASIVTVSYGQRPLLARMLGSLAATTARNVEVVLVDNASPDDTLTWLDQNTSGVRLVDAGRNRGFGQGCNLGLLAASAPIVVFVNTDVVFVGRWLEPLLEAVQTTGAAAPLSLDGEGNVVEAGGVIDGDGHAHVLTGAGSPDRRVVAHASAACLAVARRDLIVVGGFDPAFGMGYHEDVDLLAALATTGIAVTLDPNARVEHIGGGSFGSERAGRLAARNHVRSRRRWRWSHPDIYFPGEVLGADEVPPGAEPVQAHPLLNTTTAIRW